MSNIEIHVLHTGHVCVSPNLPYGGINCSTLKASGVFSPKSKRLWLPVSSYLIKCEYGNILFDCGWHRNMSPNGVLDKKAQLKSLKWIKKESLDDNCVESLANHDGNIKPHIIKL